MTTIKNVFCKILMKRIVPAVGLGLMGLAGCATTGQYEMHAWAQKGEYKIITRNDDLYLEKLDGSDSKQLTHTPAKTNTYARFVADGKYIVYGEINSNGVGSRYYIIPADSDDSQRKEISEQEFVGLR